MGSGFFVGIILVLEDLTLEELTMRLFYNGYDMCELQHGLNWFFAERSALNM